MMVHIAPRTQVHLNILERLFTGDRKEECYIGPFSFFHSSWKKLHFFCFISVFLNLFERTPTVNQDWVVSGSLSLRQSLQGNKQTRWFITHLDSGFSGWPKNSIFNGKWKLTIYKKRQRGRLSVQYVLKWTHAFMDGLKVHFFHATALPLSLKAFLFESFYRKSRA